MLSDQLMGVSEIDEMLSFSTVFLFQHPISPSSIHQSSYMGFLDHDLPTIQSYK